MIAGWFQRLVWPLLSGTRIRLSQGRPELTVSGLNVGDRYLIRSTTDFTNWSAYQTITAEGPVITLTLTNDLPHLFFSVAPN
jgi:hypothetical protein